MLRQITECVQLDEWDKAWSYRPMSQPLPDPPAVQGTATSPGNPSTARLSHCSGLETPEAIVTTVWC